jgi:hypothetical protein
MVFALPWKMKMIHLLALAATALVMIVLECQQMFKNDSRGKIVVGQTNKSF